MESSLMRLDQKTTATEPREPPASHDNTRYAVRVLAETSDAPSAQRHHKR